MNETIGASVSKKPYLAPRLEKYGLVPPPIEPTTVKAGDLMDSATPADLHHLRELQAKGENIRGMQLHYGDLTPESVDDLVSAYETMGAYFGKRNEIGKPSDFLRRMGWNSKDEQTGVEKKHNDDYQMAYRMVVLKDENASVMGAADYHLIYKPNGTLVAHLEHIYTNENVRGKGAAQLLRAAPLEDAKEFIAKHSLSAHTPITVVLEVEALRDEYDSPEDAQHIPGRRRSYHKAGYSEIPNSEDFYAQPDYRNRDDIYAKGPGGETGEPEPVPLSLLVWRDQREKDTEMTSDELRELTDGLYAMYGRAIDGDVMKYCKDEQDRKIQEYLSQHPSVKLIPVITADNPDSLQA